MRIMYERQLFAPNTLLSRMTVVFVGASMLASCGITRGPEQPVFQPEQVRPSSEDSMLSEIECTVSSDTKLSAPIPAHGDIQDLVRQIYGTDEGEESPCWDEAEAAIQTATPDTVQPGDIYVIPRAVLPEDALHAQATQYETESIQQMQSV